MDYESIPEEPKCIYNRTLDERKKFCRYCSAACSVRIEEEPASEDLEEEIGKYTTNHLLKKRNHSTGVYHLTQRECDDIASHFAEWQKQQMMKDAVDGEVMYSFGTALEKQYKVTSERIKMDGLKLGDKVKIIIIKPEQQ